MASPSKFPPLVIPGLRGNFGSWIYYACLIPVEEIRRRVGYATEIHTNNKPLSDLIQRSLEGPRAVKIANYLSTNKERFFSSLVLALYGGDPDWLEIGNVKSASRMEVVKEITDRALDSIGFLRLSGRERIFAVDGQHRVAGIRQALDRGVDLEGEVVPVILVGYDRTTAAGRQRERRLFTTLNKLAVPVSKKDIIALDEDDVMAITVRRIVEEDKRFMNNRIAITAAQQIPPGNRQSLTTIGNLYDILKLIFLHEGRTMRADKLRFNRPDDSILSRYYDLAGAFFSALADVVPELKAYFGLPQPEVGLDLRSSSGGHLLFRPIGLEIVTRVAIRASRVSNIPLMSAIPMLVRLPLRLELSPFSHIIWDPARSLILTKGKALAVRLAAHMIGLADGDPQGLLADYRRALGADPDDGRVRLPTRGRPRAK
jgi:DNA sulfur modification protein DndB